MDALRLSLDFSRDHPTEGWDKDRYPYRRPRVGNVPLAPDIAVYIIRNSRQR